MLSLEEALLFKAAQEEQEKQQAINMLGTGGAIGGALLGATAGTVPHNLGRAVNAVRGRRANPIRPGFRAAGGLTGAILGGALGAGTAAMMKQNNPAAQLLGKIQATGELTDTDERQLASILTDIYSNPSQLG